MERILSLFDYSIIHLLSLFLYYYYYYYIKSNQIYFIISLLHIVVLVVEYDSFVITSLFLPFKRKVSFLYIFSKLCNVLNP